MGLVSGCPCEWHWMQVSFACTASAREGLKMLPRAGCAACAAPGPWHFSQPTFHSATCFVRTSYSTEWQPSHVGPVGRFRLSAGYCGTHQSVLSATKYRRQSLCVTSHCAPSGKYSSPIFVKYRCFHLLP